MGPVSSAAVEAVYRRSGGVPFVVEELMRCAGPGACSDDIVSAQLPWSLEEAVRQQLADLAPPERLVVDALGVFGVPAPFELLAELTGLDERELLVLLRHLVERGVVEESRDDRLWFAHALLADAVPHQLLGRERRRLHECCFEILRRVAPDHHAELAHHAAGAGRFDEIVPIAREGSRHYLDRGASFQAQRLACEGLAEDAGDPDLLAVATEAAWRLDFLPEAVEHAAEWQRVARTRAELIEATRYVARLHHELGHAAECEVTTAQLIEWAEAPLDVAPDAPDRPDDPAGHRLRLVDRARAEAAVAQLRMLRHHDDARAWADRAIDHAREAGDRAVEVQAMVERASSIEYRDLDRTSALVGLRSAADAARSIGDGVLLVRSLNNMIDLLQPNGDECKRLLRQLREVSDQYGLDKFGAMSVLWWEATRAFADGDLPSYRRLLEEWASWSPTPKTPQAKAGDLADLALEEGRLADARAILGAGQPVTQHQLYLDAMTWLALAALDHDAALGRRVFDALVARAVSHDAWSVVGMVVDSAMHAVAAGISPDEVRRLLLGVALSGHPARATIVGLAEGPLRLAEGRPHEALTAFAAIDRPLATLLARPYEATYLVQHAQALLAAGEREVATATARRAVEALSRWPGWRRDRAEALLARLEGSARTSGELTPRETEVAALIAEGLTNGQLAERLYISPKTAAVHVSNILAKLGLSSRAEVAAWTVRHEVVGVT
jgi:DNA-binding CsgD family transcriptional regulator